MTTHGSAKWTPFPLAVPLALMAAAAWSQPLAPKTPAASGTATPAAPAAAPKTGPLDFEDDQAAAAWSALDSEAKLAVTHEPDHCASGRGALEFLYAARQGVFEQIGLSGLSVPSASCLSLKLKAAAATSISLGVQERNGAVYQGLLWLPAGKWVNVRTRLEDLILAETSTDEAGHLQASEVGGFFLADLANLAGEAGRALGWKEGEQRLWLDDLAFTDDPKTPARGRLEKRGDESLAVLEDFESEALWVLPIRQAGLKLVEGAPKTPGHQALELTYGLGRGRWVGFVTAPPGRLDRAGATKFHLWSRAALNLRLVIVLEQRDGSKYETALRVPADDKWHEGVVALTDFLRDDDVADANARLNPAQIHRVIVLVDTFDADVRANGTGSVAVDDLGLILPAAPLGPAGQ